MVLVVMEARASRGKDDEVGSSGMGADGIMMPKGSAGLSWHNFLLFRLRLGLSSPDFGFSKGGRNFFSMAIPLHEEMLFVDCMRTHILEVNVMILRTCRQVT